MVFLQKVIQFNLNIPKLIKILPHVILLIASVILPIILYKIVNAKWFENRLYMGEISCILDN